MVEDHTLNIVLDKIKRIGIEKLEDTKILIDIDDEFLDDITLKNAVILMRCVMENDDKFYPQLFSEEKLYDE